MGQSGSEVGNSFGRVLVSSAPRISPYRIHHSTPLTLTLSRIQPDYGVCCENVNIATFLSCLSSRSHRRCASTVNRSEDAKNKGRFGVSADDDSSSLSPPLPTSITPKCEWTRELFSRKETTLTHVWQCGGISMIAKTGNDGSMIPTLAASPKTRRR
jgi:hypothetical protein